VTMLRIIPDHVPPDCIRPDTCAQDAIPARCATCGHGFPKSPRIRPEEIWLKDYKQSMEALFERINRVVNNEAE
jgi:ribosomal protein L37E